MNHGILPNAECGTPYELPHCPRLRQTRYTKANNLSTSRSKLESNCDSAQRPEPQLWCQQCVSSSRIMRQYWLWMENSDRDNLLIRIGLSLRLEVSEVWLSSSSYHNTHNHIQKMPGEHTCSACVTTQVRNPHRTQGARVCRMELSVILATMLTFKDNTILTRLPQEVRCMTSLNSQLLTYTSKSSLAAQYTIYIYNIYITTSARICARTQSATKWF